MSVQAAEHCAAGNPSSRHVRYTTPAETVRLHASLTEWLATDGMSRTLAATLPERGAALWPEEWPEASFEERVALHRNEELASAEEWRDADVIYADPPMCDMVTAAAQTFPAQRVRREEFLAPMGFLFFAKPLPAEAFGPTGVDIPRSVPSVGPVSRTESLPSPGSAGARVPTTSTASGSPWLPCS
ncbi:hypothetical protein GCM10020000_87230 [Streptomyces olivoverticillatus]